MLPKKNLQTSKQPKNEITKSFQQIQLRKQQTGLMLKLKRLNWAIMIT